MFSLFWVFWGVSGLCRGPGDCNLRVFSLHASDTKLLLTKNGSEVIIFGKLTNLTRNSLEMSFFPRHFERTKSLKNYETIILKEFFS